ncbi:MAG: flagellar filament capping protein FliD [Candidatus Anaerobiospirillum pullicola]|uniref:Flagellar hook-associated protein 2 n=1 Tax=Candidatus Anaerobiospirillum pullicola TaxID=2838451 RepID=A0A948WYE4_9GAMM|nr:flagellar filament capping protein FliD [Candidatus Anaerobiospirillum pullicola]
MASMITAAGTASGIDFESIITASVNAKRAQLANRVTAPKETASLQLSGIGQLKSALSDFQDSLQALTDDNGFNSRKVTIAQDSSNPAISVTTQDDSVSANYDIGVKQLASTEQVKQTFASDAKFSGGTLSITLPSTTSETGEVQSRSFDVKIEDGMTLAQIRKQINQNDLGVTASIVSTKDGDRLVIDSGISGDEAAFSMQFTPDAGASGDPSYVDSSIFNVNTGLNINTATGEATVDDSQATTGNWSVVQGQDAIITVDGAEVTSSTNEFNDQVSGISITAHRVTFTTTTNDQGQEEVEENTVNVDISQDNDAVTEKMQNFVNSYNTLMDQMDKLYKRNTYTDGENQMDGGSLAGDSMLRSLQNQLQNMMTSFMPSNSSGLDIYSMGIEFDGDGKMSLDTTTFKESLDTNFNSVVNMFSGSQSSTGSDGILVKLDNLVEDYTKTNGMLDKREQALNDEISMYEREEEENEAYLEQYEESLRQRYSKVDTTIANYNNALNYLYAALV